jgi:hypothetical protein
VSPDSGTTLGIEAKLRLYLKDWDGLRLYVAPGYAYARFHSKSSGQLTQTNPPFSQTSSLDMKRISHDGSGVWGIQYDLSDRVSLFGEIGATYQQMKYSTITTTVPDIVGDASPQPQPNAHRVTLKNSIGLIFYLK